MLKWNSTAWFVVGAALWIGAMGFREKGLVSLLCFFLLYRTAKSNLCKLWMCTSAWYALPRQQKNIHWGREPVRNWKHLIVVCHQWGPFRYCIDGRVRRAWQAQWHHGQSTSCSSLLNAYAPNLTYLFKYRSIRFYANLRPKIRGQLTLIITKLSPCLATIFSTRMPKKLRWTYNQGWAICK